MILPHNSLLKVIGGGGIGNGIAEIIGFGLAALSVLEFRGVLCCHPVGRSWYIENRVSRKPIYVCGINEPSCEN